MRSSRDALSSLGVTQSRRIKRVELRSEAVMMFGMLLLG